jgi:hypothetical protein
VYVCYAAARCPPLNGGQSADDDGVETNLSDKARRMCSDLVMAQLRAFPLVFILILATGAARAGSIHVRGTAGYISEWQLSGDLTEAGPVGSQQFSGSLTWKHVGLCSSNGAEEKLGYIKVQVSRLGSMPRIGAMRWPEGIECTFSESSRFMDCSDGNRVPLTLSIDGR